MDRTTIEDAVFPNCPIRNILAKLCDKWSLLVIYTLNKGKRIRDAALSIFFLSLYLCCVNKKSNMIAAKLYESVWNAFLKELPRNPTVTLSSVQKKWHTNRKGMRRWMSNNGLSVKEAKKRIRGCNQCVTESQIPPIPEVADTLTSEPK